MPHRLLADTKKGQLTQVDCTLGNTRRSGFPQQPYGSPMLVYVSHGSMGAGFL